MGEVLNLIVLRFDYSALNTFEKRNHKTIETSILSENLNSTLGCNIVNVFSSFDAAS